MQVKIEGIKELTGYFSILKKEEIPKAFEITINKTLKAMQVRLEDEARQTLDRPTTWAVKSTFIDPMRVTAKKYTSGLRIKDKISSGTPQIKVMGQHVMGGSRHKSAHEGWMIARGYMAASQFIVPGPHAKKNSYGNQTRSEIKKIITALSGDGTMGAWRVFISTDGKTVFSVKKQQVKVLWFLVDSVQYSDRYNYFDVGLDEATKKLIENADYAIQKAIERR